MSNTTHRKNLVKHRKSFRKALIDEGITLGEFARRLDITPFHLSRAFRDPSAVSARIHLAIEALIEKHRPSAAA